MLLLLSLVNNGKITRLFIKKYNKKSVMRNTIQLDTSGLLCPEPVMMLHKAIRSMEVGDVVELIATDPSTERDVPKFCHFLGHILRQQKSDEIAYYYTIEKV